MPHKKNPISSENICGCARLMRGYIIPAFEDISLWHERDISHSSVERVIIPDATELIDYMLNRFKGILDNLIVYEDNMLKNIYKTNGAIFSQRVMTKLIEKGSSREEAYDKIQKLALISYNEEKDFKQLVLDSEIKDILTEEEILDAFKLDFYFKNIDYIYEKCNIK
jgi:adenylosuccinate lyase